MSLFLMGSIYRERSDVIATYQRKHTKSSTVSRSMPVRPSRALPRRLEMSLGYPY